MLFGYCDMTYLLVKHLLIRTTKYSGDYTSSRRRGYSQRLRGIVSGIEKKWESVEIGKRPISQP